MESDTSRSPPRSGAVGTGATTPAAAPSLDRLLRRKGKPLPAALFLKVAEWVYAERRSLRLTQLAMARKHGIPERQVATYEAAAKWPAEAKEIVRANPDHFRVSDLTRLFANRSWRSKDTLLNALKRHAAGRPPRKRRGTAEKGRALDPDVLALKDRLRDRLRTRVDITGDGRSGELRIAFFSPDDLDRVLAIIGA